MPSPTRQPPSAGQGHPWDRHPCAGQGPLAVGPGRGGWWFLGEVLGDTPEWDQPVLTLGWSLRFYGFLFRPRRLDTRLRPSRPRFSSCPHILADSLKEFGLCRLETGVGREVRGSSIPKDSSRCSQIQFQGTERAGGGSYGRYVLAPENTIFVLFFFLMALSQCLEWQIVAVGFLFVD